MASPTLDVTLNAGQFLPGATVTATWVATDADNSTEVLRLEGTDSTGNPVTVDMTLTRTDTFTMNRVYWPRTNTNLTINQGARTATGTMPSA